MAYPKGKPRPPGAGRKAGTPNKDTQDIIAICEAKGLNVFEAMVEIAASETIKDKKFDKLIRLAEYIYPKRKSLEHSGAIEVMEATINDYRSKKNET